jgi:rhodanese-related sulfurtransferase
MRLARRHLLGVGAVALLVGLVLGVAIGRTRTPFGLANGLAFEDSKTDVEHKSERPPATSVAELQNMLETGVPVDIIDVREPDEFAALHIPNARSIPLGALWAREGTIPRDRPVVVYCTSDLRGEIAARELTKLGITNVRYLDGGLSAWQNAGLAVTR